MIQNLSSIFDGNTSNLIHLFDKTTFNQQICTNFIDFIELNIGRANKENGKIIFDLCKKIEDVCEETSQKERINKISNTVESLLIMPSIKQSDQLNMSRSYFLKKRSASQKAKAPPKKKIKLTTDELSSKEKQILIRVIVLLRNQVELKSNLYQVLEQALEGNNLQWTECQDTCGNTVLHYLDDLDDYELSESILSFAKDLNIQNCIDGSTPLHCACRNPELVKLLYLKGAKVELLNSANVSVFECALLTKEYKTIETLIQLQPDLVGKPNVAGCEPLRVMLNKNDNKIIDFLVKNGAGSSYGKTKLDHYIELAIEQRLHSALEILVKNSLSLNYSFKHTQTPLNWACLYQNYEAVKIILEIDPRVNHMDTPDRYSPLFCAINLDSDEIICKLISYGADLNFIANHTGDNIYSRLLTDKQLHPARIKKRLDFLNAHGLDTSLNSSIILNKLLAASWGIGDNLFFYFKDRQINYEGSPPYFSLKIIKNNYPRYLSILNRYLPHCLTPTQIEKSLLTNNKMNYHLQAVSSRTILENSKICPQVIDMSWPGHATAIVFYQLSIQQNLSDKPDILLAKCNRGQGSFDRSGIEIYKVHAHLTAPLIDEIRQANTMEFFISEIDEKLKLEKIDFIPFKEQKVGNCAWLTGVMPKYAEWVLLDFKCRNTYNLELGYKFYIPFLKQDMLAHYLDNISKHTIQPDWLLLAHIRIIAEKKLKKDLTVLQRTFFVKSLEKLDACLENFIAKAGECDHYAFIHYLIALNDQKSILELLIVIVDFDLNQSYRGTTPLATAQKKGEPNLITFLQRLGAKN